MKTIEMKAVATCDDPIDQIREALSGIRAQLRAGGGRPTELTSMVWTVARPARFHFARREVDLAYREVFSGARPPVTFRTGTGRLIVEATADVKPLDNEKPVWRQYTMAQLAQQMTPRNHKPMDEVFLKWRTHASAFRKRHTDAVYDLRYGPTAFETLDLFYPEKTDVPPPLWVFLHGGAHQASDKSDMSHCATAMVKAGYAVAMPNYGLCPEVPLAVIASQLVTCMHFLHNQAEVLEYDPDSIHIAGSSAGGHLAAWLVTEPELSFIRSVLPMSGIMELQSKRFLQGELLGIESDEICTRFSPIGRPLNPGVRVGVAVGGAESDEFRRQAAVLANAWGGKLLEVAGKDHFDIKEDLELGGPLHDLAVDVASVGAVKTQTRRAS